jgi:hypothetical protein
MDMLKGSEIPYCVSSTAPVVDSSSGVGDASIRLGIRELEVDRSIVDMEESFEICVTKLELDVDDEGCGLETAVEKVELGPKELDEVFLFVVETPLEM